MGLPDDRNEVVGVLEPDLVGGVALRDGPLEVRVDDTGPVVDAQLPQPAPAHHNHQVVFTQGFYVGIKNKFNTA